jgi:CelD/BcsL family acetyltransferase involved in cellulose biosynthesis
VVALTTIQVLGGTDARSFLAAPDRWSRLLRGDERATAYQTPAYLLAHARHLPPNATPLVLVAEDATAPVAALALVREHLHDRPRISTLGSPQAEYVRPVGPAAEDPFVVDAMLRTLNRCARDGESVHLSDVPRGSALGRRLLQQPGWSISTADCATVPLPVPYRTLGASTRREHQKRSKKWAQLERDRDVEFRRCTGSVVLPAWESLVGLYQAQRRRGRPPAERELLDIIAAPSAFVAQLSVDGVPVAADLCLTRGERVYSLLPAMNPDLSEYAPGHALLRYLTDDLSTSSPGRFTALDLGRTRPGQHGYKSQYGPRWTSTVTASSSLVWRAQSARPAVRLEGAA